jgi:Dipeptidyl aminopeptidases/acylaminoacyl-peptidases
MRRFFVIGLLFCTAPAFAQKKNFTYEQLFGNVETDVFKPMPAIKGWTDATHYIIAQKESGGATTTLLTDVRTGKSMPYHEPAPPASTLPHINVPGGINITPSPDNKWVAYTKKDNNLYVLNKITGKETALTKDGSDVILNGYASWVYYEEILGRSSRYKAFWWSPDSKRICFMRFDDSQVPVFPIYVNEGQHGCLETQRYPKAGDKNPEVKIGIATLDGQTTWADFNAADDQYFGTPVWSPGGQLWVQWMNRDQTNLKFYDIDLSTGRKKEVYDEKQDTWIDLDESNRIEFLPSGKGCIIKSDKDGWENLYRYNMEGQLQYKITNGNFWGTSIIKIDEKAGVVYFKARKENSARFDIYKTGLKGKGLTRLSFGEYSFDQVNMSPDGKYLIATYSNLSSPPAMAILTNKGKLVREIYNAKGVAFDAYNLPTTRLVRVQSGDGQFRLPVTITYPIGFDSTKKYPVLISIYGGPNAGSVYDRWKPLNPNSQWLAQEGVIQVTFDNRASGHFGKKGLNYIHRRLGIWEIEDFMTCGRWLKQQSWVDSNKLCMTGGSFGGYMTCMALTYGADVFPYGIAMSSVTDWQFYDTHYTERFMDTPKDNAEGYKATSVMTHADKYKGLLRIVHGSSDDNVHMQNSLVLVNRLQDLKKHFELMVYPGERHGISGLKGVHNRLEILRFCYEHLLEKPMPAVFWQAEAKSGF